MLFVLASFIGLTSFYGLWLRAKGLHWGGTKVSNSTGWGVAIMIDGTVPDRRDDIHRAVPRLHLVSRGGWFVLLQR